MRSWANRDAVRYGACVSGLLNILIIIPTLESRRSIGPRPSSAEAVAMLTLRLVPTTYKYGRHSGGLVLLSASFFSNLPNAMILALISSVFSTKMGVRWHMYNAVI